MKNKKAYILLSLIILFCLTETHSVYSQWAILKNDADSLVLVGVDYIYNVEFDKAEKCFQKVQQMYPNHPAGYFLDAMIEWWKINLDPDNYSYDQTFFKKIDIVLNKCDDLLDQNSFDINALFFKGGALGFRGRLYTIRDSWIKAVQDAKTALDVLQKCQQIAPFNHDIMLGTGIYNYFSVKFPEDYPILKPLMIFLPGGDKRLGILQLKAASKYARYASVEAKVVLLQIFYSFENNTYEAQLLADALHSKYPNNPYFHRYVGRIYVRLGMLNEYEKIWREIFNNCIEKKFGYNYYAAREATYYIGTALMYRGKYDMAMKYLQKSVEGSNSIDKNKEASGFKVAAYLKIGNIYDLQGNRKKAIESYKKVLEMKEWNDSHKSAKNYIDKPYREN